MALTDRKIRFAEAFLAGKTNRNAAIEAGYSAATASAAGSRLVKDSDVMDEVARMRGLADQPAISAAPAAEARAEGQPEPTRYIDPVKFLTDVMNDTLKPPSLRVDAAKALLRSNRQEREVPVGKKEEKKNDARRAGAGKFAAAAPPLRVVGRT